MYNMRKFLTDPEWYELKGKLSHAWNKDSESNVQLLRNYLGDFSDPSRLRKVSNLLTGTGFRLNRSNQIELCDLLRDIKVKRTEKT
jgi:hypothetical protein